MPPEKDEIVDIPPNRVKFFGGPGRMLLPGVSTVEAVLRRVPRSRLVTTGMICRALSKQFNVEGTCPVTTKKALVGLAVDAETHVPYWRVVNQNGSLVAQFPRGLEDQAGRLIEEGFAMETVKRSTRVKDYKIRLFDLG